MLSNRNIIFNIHWEYQCCPIEISFLYADYCLTYIVFFILYRVAALYQNFAAMGISMLLIETPFLYTDHCLTHIVYASFLQICHCKKQSIHLFITQKHHAAHLTHMQQQSLCSQLKVHACLVTVISNKFYCTKQSGH